MIVAVALLPAAAPAQTEHPLTADSERQPGVPAGRVSKHAWRSAIFPGTQRDYWVCVPAQYRPETPAAVMVFQDGGRFVAEDGRWRVPVVFDNLIHRGEMPVTVGVGGSSSGGICAFTAAWNRPDAFRRVRSFIGSYTGLRGGDSYATLIRKTEPRPIRVFLQDGSRDLDIYSGNWWVGNQAMASALEYAGYDVRFIAGAGGHDSNHGSAILPDALRWRWREWKEPITPSSDGKESMIAGGLEVDHLVVGANGGIWATDASHRRVWYVDPHGGKRVVHEGLRSPRAGALGRPGPPRRRRRVRPMHMVIRSRRGRFGAARRAVLSSRAWRDGECRRNGRPDRRQRRLPVRRHHSRHPGLRPAGTRDRDHRSARAVRSVQHRLRRSRSRHAVSHLRRPVVPPPPPAQGRLPGTDRQAADATPLVLRRRPLAPAREGEYRHCLVVILEEAAWRTTGLCSWRSWPQWPEEAHA